MTGRVVLKYGRTGGRGRRRRRREGVGGISVIQGQPPGPRIKDRVSGCQKGSRNPRIIYPSLLLPHLDTRWINNLLPLDKRSSLDVKNSTSIPFQYFPTGRFVTARRVVMDHEGGGEGRERVEENVKLVFQQEVHQRRVLKIEDHFSRAVWWITHDPYEIVWAVSKAAAQLQENIVIRHRCGKKIHRFEINRWKRWLQRVFYVTR